VTLQQAAQRSTHYPEKVMLDPDELRRRLPAVDPGLLLPVAVHVTGDTTLVERYVSRLTAPRIRQLITAVVDGDAQVSDERSDAHRELTELIVEALSREDQPPYLTGQQLEDLGVFGPLTEFVSGGWNCGSGDHGMYLQQSGFEPDAVTPRAADAVSRTLNVAIVGAGMAGIDAAVKATQRGFDYEIYDMESGVGGLWWTQRYPGVAVDTQSLTYSLSWNQSAAWSRIYPKGDEYRTYLTEMAEEYGVLDHVHLQHQVLRMEWLEDRQQWELTIYRRDTKQTLTVRAEAVVTAAGLLNRPKYPDVDGREMFAGEQVHTVQWRDIAVEVKRVAVVGAGAAAVQVVSALAGKVDHLTVFQRQPHWVSPNPYGNGTTSDDERWLLQKLPYLEHWSRLTALLHINKYSVETKLVDADWWAEHPYSVTEASEAARLKCLAYIDRAFGLDSELAKKVTPEFSYGAKRPVFDPGDFSQGEGYYYALSQDHVDVETAKIARVVPEGVLTDVGRLIEVDVIIWATGMTLDYLSQIAIIGRDGAKLSRVWAGDDPRTYLGGAVPGFPNLFVQDGPNTGVATGGSGHNFIVEVSNHYAFEALTLMVNSCATSIEVTQEAHDRYHDAAERRMQTLLWAHDQSADTYYRNQAGRVVLVNPFWPGEFWNMTRVPEPDKFILRNRRGLATSGNAGSIGAATA
jgi:cation diffusion facilitator CzcD-associated flavoprotein CzcO